MLGTGGVPAPGRQRVTTDELHAHLVAPFGGSSRRADLFEAWKRHREDLSEILAVHSQWIGGSFVSTEPEPPDVDVITLFSGPEYDALSLARQRIADKLMEGPRTKLFYGIDSYPLAMYPEGHADHEAYLQRRGYWDWWLGRVKSDEDAARGYLEVVE